MPLTAVLGRYGDGSDIPAETEVSDAEIELLRQERMKEGPMDLYLHGNAAALLYKAIRESDSGQVRVCISSTKGKKRQPGNQQGCNKHVLFCCLPACGTSLERLSSLTSSLL